MRRKPHINHKIKYLVLRETLVSPSMIASGQSGEVKAFTYTGKNAKLVELVDANDRMAVKSYKTSVNHIEIRNVQHLNAVTGQASFYPKQLPVFLDDNSVHIAYELVTYADNKSANFEEFLLQVVNNIFIEPDAPTIEGFKHALRDFTVAIVQLQNKVHQADLLHLDTALRNFLVARPLCYEDILLFKAKITDFGLSKKLNCDGTALPIPLKDAMIPLRRYNQDVLTFRKHTYGNQTIEVRNYTIHTDIFSRKVTIMEMLGVLLGKNELEVLTLDRTNIKPTPEEVYQQRSKLTDEDILTAYVSNLEYYIAEHEDQERADIAREFLSIFKHYLTSMPPRANHTLQQVMDHDLQLFNQTVEAYSASLSNDFKAELMLKHIMPNPKKDKLGFFSEAQPVRESKLVLEGYDEDFKFEHSAVTDAQTRAEESSDKAEPETQNSNPFEIKPHRF